MKRFALLVLAAGVVAFGISRLSRRTGGADGGNVFRLLPNDTLAVAVLPDFASMRSQWHQSDAYKLWKEPAVQDFLQRPLATNPAAGEPTRSFQELETLGATDLFVAVTKIEFSAWKIAAGFQFKGSQQDAEKIVERRLAESGSSFGNSTTETADYHGHAVRVTGGGIARIATAFDGKWFFAANDLDVLKLLLDRADQQPQPNSSLADEPTFVADSKQMPREYAAFVYGRLESLLGAATETREVLARAEMLRRFRSFCAALWFDGGRIRDRSFAQMPKMIEAELGRSGLALANKETWLYAAALTDLTAALLQNGEPSGLIQPLAAALSASGVTADDWNAAFAPELNVLADWPQDSRWPRLLAAIPIRDFPRAKRIGSQLATAAEQAGWTIAERNGVQYFSIPTGIQMVALEPTLALSDRMFVAGLGPESIESALKGAGGSLDGTPRFHAAETLVPAGKQSFAYMDTELFYTRFDTAIRPMLLMGAAFVPAIRDAVDLSKLPSPDVITKHLSPLVASQSYTGDGYLTDSVGPITLTQLAVTAGALSLALPGFYKQHSGLAAPLPSFGPAISPVPPRPVPTVSASKPPP